MGSTPDLPAASQPPAEAASAGPQPAERRQLTVILLGFAVLSVAYSMIIPLGFGPDEPRHYAYVKLLMEERKLPRTYPGERERGGAIAVHPPLYYALLGILYYPAKVVGGAWAAQRLYRLISTGLGICALLCVWAIARSVFPDHPQLALFTTAAAGLIPHFLMDQSIINNDSAANVACPFFVWFALTRRRAGWRVLDAAWCGVLLGLAALVKGQVLACLPPVFLVVLAWDYGRTFWRRRDFWLRAGLALGLLVLISGWWYARNVALYGQITYLPTEYRAIPSGMSLADAWVEGIIPALMVRAAVGLFESIWAQIGWFPSGVANLLYVVLALLVGIAIGGWARVLMKRRRGEVAPPLDRPRELVTTFTPFVTAYLLVFYIAIFQHVGWYQGGRYILVGLSGFVLFLTAGWHTAVPPRFRVAGGVAVLGFLLLLNAVSMWNLVTHLNPTYAPGFDFWSPIAGTH